MNLSNNHTLAIKQIVRENYEGYRDRGAISDYIQPCGHFSDFELSEGLKLRIKEEKLDIFYNVFREK